jgi:hypothetical protein
MLATVFVLGLVVVAFWRSLFRLLLAALLVLIVVGGIQAIQVINAIVTVTPQQTHCPADSQRPGGC